MINKTPLDKFPLLLTRVIQKLHIRDARLFSAAEESQLKTLFSFTDEELRLVLDGCCYVFEQAAFTSTNPEVLYGFLLDAGFDEAHGKALGRLWAAEAPGFVSKLKARALGGPSVLETDYHLNLIMGESSLSRLQEPTALFEFTIGTSGRAEESQTEMLMGDIKKIGVEFSHSELFSFFTQLERIQGQLDNLS